MRAGLAEAGQQRSTALILKQLSAGTMLCRSCLQEHCVQANHFQWEIGKRPDCPYSQFKKIALAKNGDN